MVKTNRTIKKNQKNKNKNKITNKITPFQDCRHKQCLPGLRLSTPEDPTLCVRLKNLIPAINKADYILTGCSAGYYIRLVIFYLQDTVSSTIPVCVLKKQGETLDYVSCFSYTSFVLQLPAATEKNTLKAFYLVMNKSTKTFFS